MKKYRRELEGALRERGFDVEWEPPRRGHLRFIARRGGCRGQFTTSCTPRDTHHAIDNNVKQVLRAFATAEGSVPAAGDPRKSQAVQPECGPRTRN